MQTLKQKLMSRKFWMAIGEFLFGVGSVCIGVNLGIPELVYSGYVLVALSVVVYNITETVIDAKKVVTDLTTAMADGTIDDTEKATLIADADEIKDDILTDIENIKTLVYKATSLKDALDDKSDTTEVD